MKSVNGKVWNTKTTLTNFREKLSLFIKNNERFCLLNTGEKGGQEEPSFDLLAGWGTCEVFQITTQQDLIELDKFIENHRGKWIFGHMSYELKDLLEPGLTSNNPAHVGFPLLSFFVAEYVCSIKNDEVFFSCQSANPAFDAIKLLDEICSVEPSTSSAVPVIEPQIESFKTRYKTATNQIHQHILRGDIYELNYCLPFQSKGTIPDPSSLWISMQTQQRAPFSALYRQEENWLLCCSPERFMAKKGEKIFSQPIKGTAPRAADPELDAALKSNLYHSEKERAENVMIVDLVRNDLGKIAKRGSVKVEELCGIYSFPGVHQMISTVSASIKNGIGFVEILKALFPMGSMTGAPKIRAMEIIEEQEFFRRGIYSGSVGYISPTGDFDFNVVIRSILYNSSSNQLLYPAGSALTANSDPEKEFEECTLKAEGMKSVLKKFEKV